MEVLISVGFGKILAIVSKLQPEIVWMITS
jgi:hypothetical protein